jgi:hypothetical protein
VIANGYRYPTFAKKTMRRVHERPFAQRQPGTTEDPELNDTVLNQRQCDSILTLAEQTLGTINRIQRPEPSARAPAPSIDQGTDLIEVPGRVGESQDVDDACGQLRGVAQCRGIFFGDQCVGREVTAQSGSDERLDTEISNCHG